MTYTGASGQRDVPNLSITDLYVPLKYGATVVLIDAERGKEPLKTFATYRRDKDQPTNVNFGTNLIHETKRCRVAVGDAVTSL